MEREGKLSGMWATGVLWLRLAAASVGLVSVGPSETPQSERAWPATRAAEVVGYHLRLHGFAVAVRPSTWTEAVDVRIAVRPKQLTTGAKRARWSMVVRTAEGRVVRAERRAPGDALDRIAAEFAATVTEALGGAPWPAEAQAILAPSQPFAVHRYLGQARLRMERGAFQQAALMYSRAATVVRGREVPEARIGHRRAQLRRESLAGGVRRDLSDLAASARERVEVGLRNGRTEAALEALGSYLRYGNRHALIWELVTRLPTSRVILTQRDPWQLQTSRARWSIEQSTGVLAKTEAPRQGLVEQVQQQDLVWKGGQLRRLRGQSPLWSTPVRTVGSNPRVFVASGFVGVAGPEELVWLDLATGRREARVRGASVLGWNHRGALVRLLREGQEAELSLVRAGQRSRAWQAALPGRIQARLTNDRIVAVTGNGLAILRADNGKTVRSPLPLSSGSRLLAAGGRHAAVLEADGVVSFFDVLAAEALAKVTPPGAVVDAHPYGDGVALLTGGGDVLFFGREGQLFDRARVLGEPRRFHPADPGEPGMVVETAFGLYALGEVPLKDGLMRDVDAEILRAELLERLGRRQEALRLATHVALRSVGRVGRAERLRAKVLEAFSEELAKKAVAAALRRARSAEDPSRPLGSFSLF